MTYVHLNQHIASDNEAYSDAWRRVLNRLGEYTAAIVQSLKMRPERVEWLTRTQNAILIRVRLPSEYVVLRIAPEENLAREVFFARTMIKQHLPTAKILEYDASGALVPFAYTLESYIGGIRANELTDEPLLRSVARQVGRVLRQLHRIEAPGWRGPGPTGRWATSSWRSVLTQYHDTQAPAQVAQDLFGEERKATITAMVQHLSRICPKPQCMHGDISPHAVRCTTSGEQVHLGAIADPGLLIGGDGLLDLALGMNPVYPQAWNSGLYDGYTAMTALNATDQERLRLLQVLVAYWRTCQCYIRFEPYQEMRQHTIALLADVVG